MPGAFSVLQSHNCNPKTIRSAKKIREFVVTLCDKIRVKRYGPCTVVNFGENEDVAGYSMMQLIETSLISGHFVNKTNRVFLDVFSCAYYNPKTIADYAKEFFGANSIKYKYILRK